MPIEQGSLPFGQPEQEGIVPVSYVLDGVFFTPDRKVIVRQTPETSQFSPNKLDLPSMEIDRVRSPREMRHAMMSIMRANVGVSPISCINSPFMANRTIAKNNGSYRETRRIFYRGSIGDTRNLPTNYKLIPFNEIHTITNWRRPSLIDAVTFAHQLIDNPPPEGAFIMTSDKDGALSSKAIVQSQGVTWDLRAQMDAATRLEEMQDFTMTQLR